MNFENQSAFDKVRGKNIVAAFFLDTGVDIKPWFHVKIKLF